MEQQEQQPTNYLQKHLDPNYNQEHTNRIITLQRNNDIIAMLLDGKESKEIKQYLCSKYTLSPKTANGYLQFARRELKNRKNAEVDTLINLHIHRYEAIYAELRKLKAHIASMDALKAKEKLMGFHREGFHMKVSKGEIQQIYMHNVADEYDFANKLDDNERKRFEEIMGKAKRKQDSIEIEPE